MQKEFSKEELQFIKEVKSMFGDNVEGADKSLVGRLEQFCQSSGLICVIFNDSVQNGLEVKGVQKNGKIEPLDNEDILTCVMGSFTAFAAIMGGMGFKIEPMKNMFITMIRDILKEAIKNEGKFIFNYELEEPNFYKLGGIKVGLAQYLNSELEKIVIS